MLTVGNVTERKGQANVIKHLPTLKKKYPDIQYHCVGFKTQVDACIDLAKSLNVLEHVTFHGHVTHQQLNSFYENTDICVKFITNIKWLFEINRLVSSLLKIRVNFNILLANSPD